MSDPNQGPGPDAFVAVASRLMAVLESRIAPALERIAEVLERAPSGGLAPDPRGLAVAEVRRAIREGELILAGTLLSDLNIDFPDAAESPALAEELAEAGRVKIDDRRSRLDAARAANDPEAVLTYRDELAGLLEPSVLGLIDKEILGWVMALLMKRMRTGTVRPDVAQLAARVASSFAHRPEGASLKASLPTIRRSAGLCARCGEPYTGVEDACPECLAGVPRIADLPETPGAST